MITWYDIPLEDLQATDWWPKDRGATITAGSAGHEHEIVINFEAFWMGNNGKMIPPPITELVAQELPEAWDVESRGSRIEVHPTGRFAGGWCEDDVAQVRTVLEALGFEPASVIIEPLDADLQP